MVTSDVPSYFISTKAEKKDSQVPISQLVKTSDNVTVAEVFSIKTELKYSCKEKKNSKFTCLRKSKTKLVNMHTYIEHRQQLHTFVENVISTFYNVQPSTVGSTSFLIHKNR